MRREGRSARPGLVWERPGERPGERSHRFTAGGEQGEARGPPSQPMHAHMLDVCSEPIVVAQHAAQRHTARSLSGGTRAPRR